MNNQYSVYTFNTVQADFEIVFISSLKTEADAYALQNNIAKSPCKFTVVEQSFDAVKQYLLDSAITKAKQLKGLL